mgnify:FL=1
MSVNFLLKRFYPDAIEYFGLSNGIDLAHLTLEEIDRWFPAIWSLLTDDAFHSFTVVRHPVTRAISAFNWFNTHIEHQNMSFMEYLAATRRLGETDCRFVHALPQNKYIFRNGIQIPTRVLKFENIDSDLRSIFNEFQLLIPPSAILPQKNVLTNHKVPAFTDDVQELLLDIYQHDFSLFGYGRTFNDGLFS